MPLMFRIMNRIHPWLYRRAGGKGMVASVQGMPVLLLTTTGRRSGARSSSMVGYFAENGSESSGTPNGDLIVCASAGGTKIHPGWALNLRTNPDAEVQVGTDTFPVRAEWTKGVERDRLWQLLVSRYPFFGPYEPKAAPRVIPMIRLHRLPSSSAVPASPAAHAA